jgi:hypothetical protein
MHCAWALAENGCTPFWSTAAMKKAIITCLIAVCSLPAVAEWVYVNETNVSIMYIDLSSIRSDKDSRRVWVIEELKQSGQDGAMSRRVREEFDCKNERYKLLSMSVHTGSMATGKSIFDFDKPNDSWSEIPPSTTQRAILEFVCAK